MSIYNKDGTWLSSCYEIDGDSAYSAFNIGGKQVFPSIRVMSYNVGSWTAYGNMATTSNQEEYYHLQNTILQQTASDVAGFQEYYSQIGTYSVPTMLAQYFSYLYAVDRTSNKAGRALASKFAMTNTSEVNFQNQSGEQRSYLIGDMSIGGKTIKFLTAHLALVTATIEAQIQELLAAVSDFDYWILTGDFNIPFPDVQSNGYQKLVKPFLDAGYHVANGGEFGFINTFYGSEGWKAIDNIMCSSNIDITDVFTNQEKVTNTPSLGIDHLPLIAELTIN